MCEVDKIRGSALNLLLLWCAEEEAFGFGGWQGAVGRAVLGAGGWPPMCQCCTLSCAHTDEGTGV